MSEKLVAVALLFDDVELGSHLRAALSEYGVRIAHEGPLSSFDAVQLRQAGVDVLVVNLDDSTDDAALDRIYDLVGAGDIPVVFNDAQASGGLGGWDRARWARHLAAKTLNRDMIDPPRPEHVPDTTPAAAPAVEPHVPAAVAQPVPPAPLQQHEVTPAQVDTSETLAAELEALLASGDAPASTESEFGTLKFSAGDALPPLHEDDFSWQDHDAPPAHDPVQAVSEPPAPAPAEKPDFNVNLDHLSLASLDEEVTPPVREHANLAQQTPAPVAPEWGFVEEEHAPADDKAPFGIEKLSAAEYLAPEVEFLDDEASPVEPGMSLELVSIAEAIAPREEYQPFESHLQELDTALARLVVLGVAHDGAASLATFLGALPGDLKLPILLTQHHDQDAVEPLAASLTAHCSLPVRVATMGMRARPGDVVVVPRGQQVRLARDGRVELTAANDDAAGQSPSIDASFTMAANVFGRNALAIVFAGQSTDAVAGAQAIHDRGGQVWVEAATSDHYTDMVNGVMAERLANFSGSPQELAARLVEDFR
jgi:two-component system chemotaxis response regulator CheB/chemosensory pili system protein ChpB (putative protein-glutamate methylesterase)